MAVELGIERVREVRRAVGPEVEILVSAQNRFRLPEAQCFAAGIRDADVALLQEPIIGNDVSQMVELRRSAGIPLALGHHVAGPEHVAQYLSAGAIDVCQYNVVTGGGYSTGARVTALCDVYGVELMNGGSWVFHNMHLLAGMSSTALGEWSHFRTARPVYAFYDGLPEPQEAVLRLPDAPGLGFAPRADAVATYAVG